MASTTLNAELTEKSKRGIETAGLLFNKGKKRGMTTAIIHIGDQLDNILPGLKREDGTFPPGLRIKVTAEVSE